MAEGQRPRNKEGRWEEWRTQLSRDSHHQSASGRAEPISLGPRSGPPGFRSPPQPKITTQPPISRLKVRLRWGGRSFRDANPVVLSGGPSAWASLTCRLEGLWFSNRASALSAEFLASRP